MQTKAGEVELTVPRLRRLPLETAIIERYKRRESSVAGGLDEAGDGAPDRHFLQAPSWPRVVDAARAALCVFRR